MKKIIAKTSTRNYPIFLGNNLFRSAPKLLKSLKDARQVLLVSNHKIDSIYHSRLLDMLNDTGLKFSIFLVHDGETFKNNTVCSEIYDQMLASNFHRTDIMIAFGGGVIGDLAGFSASTFHRGVKLVQYPTTIVSQVDSSIGGKVAVNYKQIKNIIGTFYQPHLVIADFDLLSTLETKEIINGLGEIVKYGLLFDKGILKLLDRIIESPSQLNSAIKSQYFNQIIYKCALIKTKVVARDENDISYRNLLNFGHTIGHALEKASGLTSVTHGQAVGLGMLAALDISIELGYLSTDFKMQILGLYKKIGLPTKIEGMDMDKIIKAMGYDKKFVNGKNKFVLLRNLNQPFFYCDLKQDIIINSIKNNMG